MKDNKIKKGDADEYSRDEKEDIVMFSSSSVVFEYCDVVKHRLNDFGGAMKDELAEVSKSLSE